MRESTLVEFHSSILLVLVYRSHQQRHKLVFRYYVKFSFSFDTALKVLIKYTNRGIEKMKIKYTNKVYRKNENET